MHAPTEHAAAVDLADTDALQGRLRQAGLTPADAAAKAALLTQCRNWLLKAGVAPTTALHASFVPGRIEVLGKHTDYGGGRSLLCTVQRGFCMVAAPRTDTTVQIVNVPQDQQEQFEFSPQLTPPLGHWSNYPMTVARRLARNFPGTLRGATIAFASDLPPASGMSSSSAFIIASFLALARVNRLAQRPEYRDNISNREALAVYLSTIENGKSFGSLAGDRGVGTLGGSEDHTAILCCRPGHFSQYSFFPMRQEKSLPLPQGYVLAVAVSGVVAEKTGAAMERYNQAARLLGAVLELWRQQTGRQDQCMAEALRSSPQAMAQARVIVGRCTQPDAPGLADRLEQFWNESELIIPAAGEALADGHVHRFGELVARSQQLAQTMLHNQTPQTAHLASSARKLGAAAASAFGAGFGGSIWALVQAEAADQFLRQWAADYRDLFPAEAAHATFFATTPGPGCIEL